MTTDYKQAGAWRRDNPGVAVWLQDGRSDR